MTTSPGTDRKPTAADRREQVLEAAIHEFAVYGYHGAKTAEIARRAGISQPYIYALFEDKKTLFLACQDRVREDIRAAFSAASRSHSAATVEESLAIMGRGYRGLLANQDAPRCQLQGYAASDDPQIREHMRRGYVEIFEFVRRVTGADDPTVARFMATGMLLNLGTVLGLPDSYAFAFVDVPAGAAAADTGELYS
jgi:AcrR family transcriptional regulator